MIKKAELAFPCIRRFYRYLQLSESRVDTMMLSHFAQPTDLHQLYLHHTLAFTPSHQWVRYASSGHFFMGVSSYVPHLLKEILNGEYQVRDSAIPGQILGTIGNAEIDLAFEAPFEMCDLEFNSQLEWDFRWLNQHPLDIWIVQGISPKVSQAGLITPDQYEQHPKIMRW